ncbi:MAG: proline/glycine betaine ABC transporter ATP-binding protein [Firmicutes bacterium HGW-Firmicutes-9]|jgi:osmoprotectant transport system ATP-binding protein|nr:MAG: proline/glycine betaine ABC transporter ATP-binding protein [Firmicutes bacterium HGW-Firmicutes-9]
MIRLEKVRKTYDGQKNIVDDLDFEIRKGELVVLVGESGCGKTTTMKMINRLIEPDGGDIFINGKSIKSFNKNELRRNIGYVIQDIGLFPHLTVRKNVSIVPLLCKKDKAEVDRSVEDLLRLVNLPPEEYADRYPGELSGGQQQRVGFARALANDPDIILMDEPFSALDPITREQLQNELLSLQEELHKTIVFVTHDIDEAIKLGDRIAVMSEGRIIQFDAPEEILKNPVNSFVESFVGKDRLWKKPEFLKAEDVMNTKVVTIGQNRSVAHAIELMKMHNTDVLVVVDKPTESSGKILGVVGTNRFKGVGDNTIKMKDIMKSDFPRISKDMCLVDVLKIRKSSDTLYSPVMDENGRVAGIITNASIISVLTKYIPDREDY